MRGAAFALVLLLVGCGGAADEQIGNPRTEPSPSIEGLEAAIEDLEQRAELHADLHAYCYPSQETADAAKCQELRELLPPPRLERGFTEWWAYFEAVCLPGDKAATTQKRCDALKNRLHALEEWWRPPPRPRAV